MTYIGKILRTIFVNGCRSAKTVKLIKSFKNSIPSVAVAVAEAISTRGVASASRGVAPVLGVMTGAVSASSSEDGAAAGGAGISCSAF